MRKDHLPRRAHIHIETKSSCRIARVSLFAGAALTGIYCRASQRFRVCGDDNSDESRRSQRTVRYRDTRENVIGYTRGSGKVEKQRIMRRYYTFS